MKWLGSSDFSMIRCVCCLGSFLSWIPRLFKRYCVQVQKSELIVGARMGGDSWELDELEVRSLPHENGLRLCCQAADCQTAKHTSVFCDILTLTLHAL